MKNGIYNFYPYRSGSPKPLVVEVENGFAYSLHFEYTYPVTEMEGHFVRLEEVQEPVVVFVDNKPVVE